MSRSVSKCCSLSVSMVRLTLLGTVSLHRWWRAEWLVLWKGVRRSLRHCWSCALVGRGGPLRARQKLTWPRVWKDPKWVFPPHVTSWQKRSVVFPKCWLASAYSSYWGLQRKGRLKWKQNVNTECCREMCWTLIQVLYSSTLTHQEGVNRSVNWGKESTYPLSTG